ncbi:hypothetical protein DL546_002435 [Coniochaeta pulveracea]|uniref:Uncharacterized protein n=1 Tax=Coniochaeta pulveracea TaxID=177199 RepID=A0A420YLM4_9PEZI|nr:hypothetical protein DL546_002435 [Coniochaeta pulveracea]
MTKSKSFKRSRPSKKHATIGAKRSQILKALLPTSGYTFPAGLPVVIGFREDARVVQAMKAAKTREVLIMPSQVAELITELFSNAPKFMRQLKTGWSFHWKFVKSYTTWTKPLEVDDIISLVEYLVKSRKRYQNYHLHAPLRPGQVNPLLRAIDDYIAMISQDEFRNIVYWNTTLDFDDDDDDDEENEVDIEKPQWDTLQTIYDESDDDENDSSRNLKRKVMTEDVEDVSEMFTHMSMEARAVKTRKLEEDELMVTKRDETFLEELGHKMSRVTLDDTDEVGKDSPC